MTVYAYRLLDKRLRERNTPYAFHLGITEAGLPRDGTVKSAIGLGILLWEGIGDTLRVSLAADRLKKCRSAGRSSRRWACEKRASTLRRARRAAAPRSKSSNWPVRSRRSPRNTRAGQGRGDGLRRQRPRRIKMADVGIAGGKGKGAIYRKGELVGTFPEAQLLGALREEIEKVILEPVSRLRA